MEHPQAYRKRYRSRSHNSVLFQCAACGVVSVCGNDRTVCEKCSVFMCRAQRRPRRQRQRGSVERTDGGHPRRGSGVTTYNVVYATRCVSDIMQYRVEVCIEFVHRSNVQLNAHSTARTRVDGPRDRIAGQRSARRPMPLLATDEAFKAVIMATTRALLDVDRHQGLDVLDAGGLHVGMNEEEERGASLGH